jgi:hypothetical protein
MNLRNSIVASSVLLLSACASGGPSTLASVSTPAAKPTAAANAAPASVTTPQAVVPADEEVVDEINVAAHSDTIVCNDEVLTGSRISEVVCRRNVEVDQQRAQAERTLMRATGATYEGSTN